MNNVDGQSSRRHRRSLFVVASKQTHTHTHSTRCHCFRCRRNVHANMRYELARHFFWSRKCAKKAKKQQTHCHGPLGPLGHANASHCIGADRNTCISLDASIYFIFVSHPSSLVSPFSIRISARHIHQSGRHFATDFLFIAIFILTLSIFLRFGVIINNNNNKNEMHSTELTLYRFFAFASSLLQAFPIWAASK